MTHADRRREAEAEDLPSLPYARLANTILAAANGSELFETLCREFPGISRHEVFFGISIAWTVVQADLIIEILEAKQLRQQLDRLSDS